MEKERIEREERELEERRRKEQELKKQQMANNNTTNNIQVQYIWSESPTITHRILAPPSHLNLRQPPMIADLNQNIESHHQVPIVPSDPHAVPPENTIPTKAQQKSKPIGLFNILILLFALCCLFSFAFVLYHFITSLHLDLSHKITDQANLVHLKIKECADQYSANQCDKVAATLPYMATVCAEWQLCMQQDPMNVERYQKPCLEITYFSIDFQCWETCFLLLLMHLSTLCLGKQLLLERRGFLFLFWLSFMVSRLLFDTISFTNYYIGIS